MLPKEYLPKNYSFKHGNKMEFCSDTQISFIPYQLLGLNYLNVYLYSLLCSTPTYYY